METSSSSGYFATARLPAGIRAYIVYAEKDAHHKYCRYDDKDEANQRVDAGALPRGVKLAVLALRRLL